MKIFRKSALKKKDKNALLDTLREIDILKTLNHPNVIKLYEVIDDDPGDKLYLVMDYAERGQIMEYDMATKKFKPKSEDKHLFNEQEIQGLAKDLILALEYIHKQGIVHCDIKP